jgi:transcription antitermination factor NusG
MSAAQSVIPQGSTAQWFAAYTNPRHEKRVAEHFALRSIESFLPLYCRQARWKDGSRVTLELPLFPSYIFVHIAGGDRVRVLGVPGVVSIVGCGRQPSPLPPEVIERLRTGGRLRKIEPHPLLTVGARVRVRCGVFAGLAGILSRRKNDFRVIVTLEQIMQSVAVEVYADELELASLPTRRTMQS